jgi:hypothetical protein
MAGDVDAALESLDAAHVRGSTLAPYLAGLLMCFTSPGQEAANYISDNVLEDRILTAMDKVHMRADEPPRVSWRP